MCRHVLKPAKQLAFAAAHQQMVLQLLFAAALLGLSILQPAAADAVCNTIASITPLACADASVAVQALVGNSSSITISNAAFTGVCSGDNSQLGIITNFGPCHYLGSTAGGFATSGGLPCQRQHACAVMANVITQHCCHGDFPYGDTHNITQAP